MTPAVVARIVSPSIAALTLARSQCAAHRVDRQPEHPVVPERPGREADLFRHGIAAFGGQSIEPILNLLPRARLVRVTGVRTDDVLERQAFVEHRGCHRVGRLLLSVVRAGVRHDRHVERVQRVVGRVVQVPERLLDGILRLPRELPPRRKTRVSEKPAPGAAATHRSA